ncbi:hypothetical protein BO226_10800 [Rhodococcus sp. 2G]|uniref:hypothetical protein n=1 Tax=Rhodococcus sp. 2G TaxID=1570939 RepID=UPI0009038121|nr:hypothetical protein [Rhodococcus sp. 2G]APE09630.1 hypothetical protein BO226_10800 [Rhodococcus sp. 2G]
MFKMLSDFQDREVPVRIYTPGGEPVDAVVDRLPGLEEGKTAVVVTVRSTGRIRWIALDQIVAVEDAPALEPEFAPLLGEIRTR